MSDKKSCGGRARALYRGNIAFCLLSSFALLCFSAVSVALSFLYFGLGIVAFALLFLPYMFALTNLLAYYDQSKTMPTGAGIFRSFVSYFRMPFFGCYRAIRNVLKGLGLFAITYFLTLMVYGLIAYRVDAGFAADFDAAMRFASSQDVASFDSLVANSVPLNRWMSTCIVASIGVGVCGFVAFVGNYAISPLLRNAFEEAGLGMANRFYNYYFRAVQKDFFKARFLYGLFAPVLVPVCYALGVLVGIAMGLPTGGLACCGVAGIAIFLSFYVPYYTWLVYEFFDDHKKHVLIAERALSIDFRDKALRYSSDKELLDQLDDTIEDLNRRIDAFDAEASEDPEP